MGRAETRNLEKTKFEFLAHASITVEGDVSKVLLQTQIRQFGIVRCEPDRLECGDPESSVPDTSDHLLIRKDASVIRRQYDSSLNGKDRPFPLLLGNQP